MPRLEDGKGAVPTPWLGEFNARGKPPFRTMSFSNSLFASEDAWLVRCECW
jgi:hypothetical protein